MDEVWKEITGYEGRYIISNYGKIYSLKRKKFLHPETSKGYKRVSLAKDKIKNHYFVHRLVASEFVDNPNEYQYVNHKDEDRLNNRSDNLEWCTASYNINYGTRNAKLSQRAKNVLQFDFDGNVIAKYDSAMEASRELGVCFAPIYNCCNGRRKTAYGYNWRYA